MAQVLVRDEIPAPRDVVWNLVKDFGDVSAWAPNAGCECENVYRNFIASLKESARLEHLD